MSGLEITFACALAWCVVASAVALSITLRAEARLIRLKSRVDTMRLGLATLSRKQNDAKRASAPATLSARIDDLAAAAESHAHATRRELGKLWRRVQKDFAESSETEPPGGGDAFQQHLELINRYSQPPVLGLNGKEH